MTIKVEIDKYVEAVNNKIIECDYFFKYAFNNYIDEKYNSFLNKYLFKKTREELVDISKYKIKMLKTHSDNYELKRIKRHYYYKLNYLEKLKELNNILNLGTKKITINKDEIYFLNEYSNNSNHMEYVNKQHNKIIDTFLM